MNILNRFKRRTFFLVAVLLSFVAGAVQSLAQEPGKQYVMTGLVSNVIGRAVYADSSLANPWGITRPRHGPWWVADEGTGRATLYSGAGVPVPSLDPLVVAIPVNPGGVYDHSTPTGIVYNDSGGFPLEPSEPAWFIFVTRDGTIDGWAPEVDRSEAVIVADHSPDAVYTGVTIASARGGHALYVANFRQGRMDVFDADFDPVDLGDAAFIDPAIPAGFSPYNVQSIGTRVYVAFAQPDGDGRSAIPGEGLGYVDAFDTEGNLVTRLQQGPWMNAPWGMALAPAQFGDYGNSVLVGNSGSGRIAVFDTETGEFRGYLADRQGTPVSIPELHGLGFGNGNTAGPENTLFLSAGPQGGRQGFFGAITPGEDQGEAQAGRRGPYSPQPASP